MLEAAGRRVGWRTARNQGQHLVIGVMTSLTFWCHLPGGDARGWLGSQ